MDPVYVIGLAAMLVEALVQVIKGWVPADVSVPSWLWPVLSAIFGVALCELAGIDAMAALGLSIEQPIVGAALTGILISRGSNFTHDLWDRVKRGKTTGATAQNG